METRLLSGASSPTLELVGSVSSLEDALSIVSASYENFSNKVLLRAQQLPPEFFQLQTRFAGEFVQKLVNYRLYVAAVFEDERAFSDRFREYIGEARRGQQFRSFSAERDAMSWLDER